ncbi:hypothetical protein Adi01nite_64370 [Amorphoplanes digitatis]|uniref:Uncharacterized protein n=2 Tax=Actinoplanes digitatis TaxID=1868 RepID=A0A7W7HWH7_9ACTN|nr:hypothetical protein [Actinoplanes digitatis]GID97025.1 hypothetical protein Adi01nite_64370 [Actinoplanes digitatis]
MGMLYTVDGWEVWDRGQATSLMFGDLIPAVERLVKQPSGFTNTGWDEIQIDPEKVRAFLAATFRYLSHSGSAPLRLMVRGFLQVALFLDYRASGEWYPVPEGFEDITEDLHLIT